MRATCEIIADIKDGNEVPYEELKMACPYLFLLSDNPFKVLCGIKDKEDK